MHRRDETGTGVLATAIGAAVFLTFLLLATHTLLGLYATSVVSAAAWDGARYAATHVTDTDVSTETETVVRSRLPRMSDVTVDVTSAASEIAVHVGAKRPSFLPAGLANSTGLARIDRTVHMRIEEVQ